MKTVFVHGWASSPNLWFGLPDAFSHPLFFGSTYFHDFETSFPIPAEKEPFRLITHSFGLHLVPQWAWKHCHELLVLAGFRCLFSAPERQQGERHIQTMLTRLKRDGESLLNSFWKQAGLTEMPKVDASCFHIENLASDLHHMKHADLDTTTLANIRRVAVFHAADDAIVSPTQARELAHKLGVEAFIFPHGGHYLHAQPEIRRHILDFINTELS